MIAHLTWERAQRYAGTNEKGHKTFFDTSLRGGGLDSAPSPMEVVLEAAAACTSMDVLNILTKKRKHIESFSVQLEADRADTEPRVFTHIAMQFMVESPDTTSRD